MYSGRQRDLRERRAHEDWSAPLAFDQDAQRDTDEVHELESPSWGIQLNARASAA